MLLLKANNDLGTLSVMINKAIPSDPDRAPVFAVYAAAVRSLFPLLQVFR